MPAGRPEIPAAIKREVAVEAGHRCAVCGNEASLEYAHIIPWHRVHKNEASNLILLCANHHARADKEKWGEKILHIYKKWPYYLRQKENQGFVTIYFPLATIKKFTPSKVLRVRTRLAREVGLDVSMVAVVAMDAGSVLITLGVPFSVEEELRNRIENEHSLLACDLAAIGLLARPFWAKVRGWLLDEDRPSPGRLGIVQPDQAWCYRGSLEEYDLKVRWLFRFGLALLAVVSFLAAGWFFLSDSEPGAKLASVGWLSLFFAGSIAVTLPSGLNTLSRNDKRLIVGVALTVSVCLFLGGLLSHRDTHPPITAEWQREWMAEEKTLDEGLSQAGGHPGDALRTSVRAEYYELVQTALAHRSAKVGGNSQAASKASENEQLWAQYLKSRVGQWYQSHLIIRQEAAFLQDLGLSIEGMTFYQALESLSVPVDHSLHSSLLESRRSQRK